MKFFVTMLMLLVVMQLKAQIQTSAITKKNQDGKLTLTDRGIAYFVNLSMSCIVKDTPHYNPKATKENEHANYKLAKGDWPSFYGCFDWHSSVHNHWTLIRVLKLYPKHRLAPGIVARLEESFSSENIAAELKYFRVNELQMFEFPYGTSWLLKVADELINWSDPKAEKWLNNLKPLINHLVESYKFYWPKLKEPVIEGSHYSYAFGLSFALDYARSANNDSLTNILLDASKLYYGEMTNFSFDKEPNGYDFMSSGLLIADLMRKVYPQKEYEIWLKKFAPKLTNYVDAKKILKVVRQQKHDGFESHWDGYQLNRIWCLNGIMKSVSEKFVDAATKKQWIKSQEEMWNYAQESIGKGNYDIDHALSSFSVFAIDGYR